MDSACSNRRNDNAFNICLKVPKKCSVDFDITVTKIRLTKLKVECLEKSIINTNAIRNKFDSYMIDYNIDILLN